MKLVSFGPRGSEQPGVLLEPDAIAPLGPLLAEHGLRGASMNTVVSLLPTLRPAIERACQRPRLTVPLDGTRLGPPVPSPRLVLLVGGNYASHVREVAQLTGGKPPSIPVLLSKPPSALCGPRDDIVRPRETRQLDYEAEMAIVVGKSGRRIPRDRAAEHIAGFMVANDVSARDILIGELDISPLYMQLFRGKGYDTFCPTGPWLVTADELGDPSDVHVELWVNDDKRQDARTDDLIVDVYGLIESISQCVTLGPGDVILTGSPPGIGSHMQPPRFLQPGDVVRTRMSGLGEMINRVVEEEEEVAA
jgi:2-keto-4-pentenoate hydratase/2-oxohepta-3-ene-1,7-dioic acid hydratase in catechol pathway